MFDWLVGMKNRSVLQDDATANMNTTSILYQLWAMEVKDFAWHRGFHP